MRKESECEFCELCREFYEGKKKECKGPEHCKDYNYFLAGKCAALEGQWYLHEKMKKFPHYEKFTLQKDIRESIDGILDEIEMFEITKVASHLYAADRLKRRLVRKIRLAYDLGYSAMNKDAYFYCAKQTGAIGAQIGGLIKSIAENKRK